MSAKVHATVEYGSPEPYDTLSEWQRNAKSWDDVGGWTLDCNHVYGGYVVHEVINEHGGVSLPLGQQRRSSRDFCDAVRFARDAMTAYQDSHRSAMAPERV